MQNSGQDPKNNGAVNDGSANAQNSASVVPEAAPAPQAAPEPTPAAAEPVAAAPQPEAAAAPEAAKAEPVQGDASAVASERRGMAAVGYLGIFCLVPLFLAKDSEFAQYHAKQGLILAIASAVLQLASRALWHVPFGGLLVVVLGIAIFIASVMGIIKALSGERFEIPYVSEWAAKIHF